MVDAPFRAGGRANRAPGRMVRNQMATSLAGSAAHESGGGAWPTAPMSSPAQTTTLVRASGESADCTFGAQCMTNAGSTIFRLAGRLSQI